MIDVKIIKELYRENNIQAHSVALSAKLAAEHFPDEINEYLCIMGASLKLHASPCGTSKTYLMSQEEISGEYRSEESLPIINNGCLIIGYGANGDPLSINLLSGNVTYVFHDVLWEEPETPFDEMSIHLNMKLEQFLKLALSENDYPFDAHSAENYMNSNSFI